jgi:hypothetical protein
MYYGYVALGNSQQSLVVLFLGIKYVLNLIFEVYFMLIVLNALSQIRAK